MIYSMYKNEDGTVSVMVAGTVCGSEVSVKTFDTGKSVANFSIRYDSRKGQDGNWTSRYFKVDAWNRLALELAAYLHAGEDVLIWGKLKKDEYASREGKGDEFRILAERILCQPYVQQAEAEGSGQSGLPY